MAAAHRGPKPETARTRRPAPAHAARPAQAPATGDSPAGLGGRRTWPAAGHARPSRATPCRRWRNPTAAPPAGAPSRRSPVVPIRSAEAPVVAGAPLGAEGQQRRQPRLLHLRQLLGRLIIPAEGE